MKFFNRACVIAVQIINLHILSKQRYFYKILIYMMTEKARVMTYFTSQHKHSMPHTSFYSIWLIKITDYIRDMSPKPVEQADLGNFKDKVSYFLTFQMFILVS